MSNPRLEELASAISEMNPHPRVKSDPLAALDGALKLYDVVWAALCSNTDRASRYYYPGTPEGDLFVLLSRAFYEYGRES